MFKRLDMFNRESTSIRLTHEEKQSLRESLLMHMEKNPMKNTVMDSAHNDISEPSRSMHITVAIVMLIAFCLVIAGYFLGR